MRILAVKCLDNLNGNHTQADAVITTNHIVWHNLNKSTERPYLDKHFLQEFSILQLFEFDYCQSSNVNITPFTLKIGYVLIGLVDDEY